MGFVSHVQINENKKNFTTKIMNSMLVIFLLKKNNRVFRVLQSLGLILHIHKFRFSKVTQNKQMKKQFLTISQRSIKDFQSCNLKKNIYILVYCLFEEETCMIFHNLEETITLIHKIM
jgi:hypothetical protein